MAQRSIEERVAALERCVADLAARIDNGIAVKDWRQAIGRTPPDVEAMQRIDAAGQAIREAERRKARRRGLPQRAKR